MGGKPNPVNVKLLLTRSVYKVARISSPCGGQGRHGSGDNKLPLLFNSDRIQTCTIRNPVLCKSRASTKVMIIVSIEFNKMQSHVFCQSINRSELENILLKKSLLNGKIVKFITFIKRKQLRYMADLNLDRKSFPKSILERFTCSSVIYIPHSKADFKERFDEKIS